MINRIIFLLFCIFCTGALLTCSNDKLAGSETGNPSPSVSGSLAYGDGSAVQNATVTLRLKTYIPQFGNSSLKRLIFEAAATTNDTGYFSFADVDSGTYVINASDGESMGIFIDSLAVEDHDIALGTQSVQPFGSISGKVVLSNNHDPDKVLIFAFGIDRPAFPDSLGNFTFNSLNEGVYGLRFLSTIDEYNALDTFGIEVRAGETTDLGTIGLTFAGLPAPKNFSLLYNVQKQIVTLMWSHPDTSLISGYNVYRAEKGKNYQLLTQSYIPKADSFYNDSAAVQGNTYEYRVVSRSNDGQSESHWLDVHDDTVTITSAAQLMFSQNIRDIDTSINHIHSVIMQSNNNLLLMDYNTINEIETGSFLLKSKYIIDSLRFALGSIISMRNDESDRVYVRSYLGSDTAEYIQLNSSLVPQQSWNVRSDPLGDFEYFKGSLYIYSIERRDQLIKLDCANGNMSVLSLADETSRIVANHTNSFLYLKSESNPGYITCVDTSGKKQYSWPTHLKIEFFTISNAGNIFVVGYPATFTTNDKWKVHVYGPAGELRARFIIKNIDRIGPMVFDGNDRILAAIKQKGLWSFQQYELSL
jgi:hypothetical protein